MSTNEELAREATDIVARLMGKTGAAQYVLIQQPILSALNTKDEQRTGAVRPANYKSGFNYLISFGGGIGPDVWDKEIEVSAVDIADAIGQTRARIEDDGGWIFTVSQEDYPPTTREELEKKLELVRSQRDEQCEEANRLRIATQQQEAELEKLHKAAAETISYIVDYGDLDHVAGCPEDDTCGCLLPRLVNRTASLIPNQALRDANVSVANARKEQP